MVHFVKLRLSGFKSFVEPSELLIEPGTTGIVGPNGCGKSNLVEALRWVMGETSAKRMRGSEMEDVIFGGTTTRPARNLAEVVVTLDNSDRRAPLAFNEQDVLEVARRIEREGNAVYLDSILAQTDSTVVRWADRVGSPFRVAFIPDTTLPGWQRALDAARDGMLAWGGNAAGLRFIEGNSADSAEIAVEFVSALTDTGEFGLTDLSWGNRGVAQRAVIRLALRPDSLADPVPVTILRRVAAHEFGHALGLPHSGSRDDLMFPSSPVATPSRRDQATLLLLYAIPPGSIRTP